MVDDLSVVRNSTNQNTDKFHLTNHRNIFLVDNSWWGAGRWWAGGRTMVHYAPMVRKYLNLRRGSIVNVI